MSSDNLDFLGGMFDFDGDGKTSIVESFLAYQIFEDMTKDDDDEADDSGYLYLDDAWATDDDEIICSSPYSSAPDHYCEPGTDPTLAALAIADAPATVQPGTVQRTYTGTTPTKQVRDESKTGTAYLIILGIVLLVSLLSDNIAIPLILLVLLLLI